METCQRWLSLTGWLLGLVVVAWSQQSWISDQLSNPDGSLLSLTLLPIFTFFCVDAIEEACDTLFLLFVNVFPQFSLELEMLVVGFLLGGDAFWSHLLFLRESAFVPVFAWAASEVWTLVVHAISADTPDGRYLTAFRQAVCVAERPMTVELCGVFVSTLPFFVIFSYADFTQVILGLLINPFLRRSLQRPPGLFQLPSSSMLTISFLQVLIFYGFNPDIQLTLEWNPLRRHEVWRFLTPALLQTSSFQLWRNVIGQLLLSTLLQVFHCSTTVVSLYVCGILGGSLATCVFSPTDFGVGASGGLFALLSATLLTLILVDSLPRWPEVTYRPFHPVNLIGVIPFIALYFFFIATILVFSVIAFFLLSEVRLHPPTSPLPQTEWRIGIDAVVGGALVGIWGVLLLHLKGREGVWQDELRRTVKLLIFVLVSSAVGVCVLFPRSYWDPNCRLN